MSENTELRGNQIKAIEALAAGQTTDLAALQAGVTPRTVWLWKTQPAFKAALQEATDAAFSDAARMLTVGSCDAVTVLKTIMNDTDAGNRDRIAAARALLSGVLRARELVELQTRIEALESRLETMTVLVEKAGQNGKHIIPAG